jgi:uncharacterized protein (TIGR00251 family)
VQDVESLKLKETTDGVQLELRVQPGARRSAIVGVLRGALKVSVSAPPVEGAANRALLSFLAREVLGLRARDLMVVAGQRARDKRIVVRGWDADRLRATLRSYED